MGGVLLKRLFLVLILSITAYTQQTTFEKEYDLLRGGYVYQTKDQGYIVCTNYDTSAQILKLNMFGELVWKKQIKVPPNACPYAMETCNQEIIYVSSENADINLTKLDALGNLIWSRNLGSSNVEYGLSLLITEDEEIIITGIGTRNNWHRVLALKTDSSGSLLWEKDYYYKPVEFKLRQPGMNIMQYNGNILILANSYIYTISSDGDSLNTLFIQSGANSFIRTENGYILSGLRYVRRIKDDGTELWILKEPTGILKKEFYLCRTADGNIAAAGMMQIYKLTPDGDTLWNMKTSKISGFVSPAMDGGLIIAGQNYPDPSLWLLKTTGEGFYADIDFTSDLNKMIIASGSELKLEWKKKNVDKVNLMFSYDDGLIWHQIAENIDTTFYQWTVPPVNSSRCRIRVVDPSGISQPSESERFSISIFPLSDSVSVNNIKMCINSNGITSHDVISDGSGLNWKGVNAVFSDGIIWAGKKNGKILSNGTTFRTGLTPGRNPLDSLTGIYKLRLDWTSLPISDQEKMHLCYENWPGEAGAPYRDINNDGKYSRNIDQPLLKGDETIWYVSNDSDSTVSRFCYGSDPIGLEIQTTMYAYNSIDYLQDVVFKKYLIINKSGTEISDMYISQWSDVDLGDANDDCVGCDTTLNLGFIFNGDNNDVSYYGENPPALGYKILKGPNVPGQPEDSAYFNGRWITGERNLRMTSFSPNTKHHIFPDVTLGSYDGTLQNYNIMQGKFWDGSDVVDPVSGLVTIYGLAGDPVSESGWYDGEGWPNGPWPGDRRLIMTSGPFTLAEADTQEIAIAVLIARGSSNINSIAELRNLARKVQEFYDSQILTNAPVFENQDYSYNLDQNYPNPFNPTTTIKYSLAEKSFVEINVYDILGEKVMTLINEERPAGEYHVQFNAHNLSSGVYYYQLKTKDYISTKKMILIK